MAQQLSDAVPTCTLRPLRHLVWFLLLVSQAAGARPRYSWSTVGKGNCTNGKLVTFLAALDQGSCEESCHRTVACNGYTASKYGDCFLWSGTDLGSDGKEGGSCVRRFVAHEGHQVTEDEGVSNFKHYKKHPTNHKHKEESKHDRDEREGYDKMKFFAAIFVVAICLLSSILGMIFLMQHTLGGAHTSVPKYWAHRDKDPEKATERTSPDFFDVLCPLSKSHCDALQEVLDADVSSRKLVKALRVEDAFMWSNFQTFRDSVEDHLQSQPNTQRFDAPETPSEAPLSVVEDASDMFGPMDEQLSEVYLWIGTRPEYAMSIIEDGFGTHHFDHDSGATFLERAVDADKLAQEGTGLYKGCYALLLCRVVLGIQHFKLGRPDSRTINFASETIVDSLGCGREPCSFAYPLSKAADANCFIAVNTYQAYPEYILIYERGPFSSMLPLAANVSQEEWDVIEEGVPNYWVNRAEETSRFDELYPVMQNNSPDFLKKEAVQDMLQRTMQEEVGDSAVVLKVLRVEDAKLWARYLLARQSISEASWHCKTDRQSHRDRLHHLLTYRHQSHQLQQRLEDEDGGREVYLWHASRAEQAVRIPFEEHFDIRDHGRDSSGDGAPFFSDCWAKCDSFAEEEEEPGKYYRGCFAMLLCRVFVADDNEHVVHHMAEGPRRTNLSSRSQYWHEVKLADRDLVYPEYVVIYQRVHQERCPPASGSAWPSALSFRRTSDPRSMVMEGRYSAISEMDTEDARSMPVISPRSRSKRASLALLGQSSMARTGSPVLERQQPQRSRSQMESAPFALRSRPSSSDDAPASAQVSREGKPVGGLMPAPFPQGSTAVQMVPSLSRGLLSPMPTATSRTGSPVFQGHGAGSSHPGSFMPPVGVAATPPRLPAAASRTSSPVMDSRRLPLNGVLTA